MANTGKNSPLGVNVTGDYVNNTGLNINPVAASYMGASKRNAVYSFGSCVSGTCLRLLTWAINDAYNRGVVLQSPAGTSVYDNLISIGANAIPALGNAKPPTYVPVDPTGIWARTSTSATALSFAEQYGRQTIASANWGNILPGPATSGFGNYDGSYGDDLQGVGYVDQKQNATWYPYNMSNPNHSVTQWGWIRCHALQAWNEFNHNGIVVDPTDAPSYLQGYQVPDYSDFLSSVIAGQAYVAQANESIFAVNNANTFLEGTYSNMNDLISGEITNVSLSTINFGTDLENLGMALDLSKIDSFGLPSNLLYVLGNQGAITQDLSLVLLASGLTSTEISEIAEGVIQRPTEEQERKIYGAFLMMSGENLREILAPIQCRTRGLETLADLLDVRKLFPNSYSTLTVPMYNAAPGPTNSKTYYLIYTGGGVNPALSTPQMREYVGTLVPLGIPPIYETSTVPKNYRDVPEGFDSYLASIIPANQAVAAGAFSFTMRQISGVETFEIQQFAKVVKGIENVSDLPLIAGTNKPTNQNMIDQSTAKDSLGTGPYGSYTLSDLFGCMSGLPYPWKLIQERIKQAETRKLNNIYRELFLAVTWEGATVSVQYTTYTGPGPAFATFYKITGVTLTDSGGGYGRGGAAAPVITIAGGSGATAVATIGTDDSLAGSTGTGSFGRVTSVTLTSPGTDTTTLPTITIQYPPTAGLPITSSGSIATGGTNTSSGTTGWSQPMNQVVSAYIGQANEEITNILQNNPTIANYLNTYWNAMGTQLLIEQRARYKAYSPVAIPKDVFSATFPSVILNLIDYLPQLAQDTRPHMAAQIMEAMSDTTTVGGQSTIAMMRQERNQARLQLLGIEQDNNIPDQLSEEELKQLTTNGTLLGAIPGTGIPGLLGEYTLPAWPTVTLNNTDVTPQPAGKYLPDGFWLQDSFVEGDITQILDNVPDPAAGPLVTVGPRLNNVDDDSPIIIQPAQEFDPNNLPPNLDPRFTNSTLLPAVPNVKEAIDRVIECNCDCWI
jgi:hypothetical protein